MTRTLRNTSRRTRALVVAVAIAALTPAGVALADPDTNIQKPGHGALALDGPDTGIQKPGHVAISRPFGDA